MRQVIVSVQAVGVLLAVVALSGCGPDKKPVVKGNNEKPQEHAHEHPAHGPNGGHVVELESPDKPGEHQHAEWVIDDENGKVLVVMLAENNKDEVGIDAEVVSIEVKIGDKTETSTLQAANRTAGEKATATRFEVADQKLLTTLSADDPNAMIRVTIDGAEFSGKIVQHKH
jgi:hypothetical protein